MADETFEYYITYSYLADGQLRNNRQFITVPREVQTKDDVTELEKAIKCPFSSVTILDWRRIS